MTTTTADYLAVTQNLARYQAMTAAEPAVKTATAYYQANIGKVTSIQDFVGNYRLLSYALDAYGLGNQIGATALVTKVLEGGVSDPKSLANTLSNSSWRAFAAAYDFAGQGAASVSSASAVKTTTADYVEQQLESDQGAEDVGVQLALYFQRVAPTISNEYGVLADPNLLEVAQIRRPVSVDERDQHRCPGERAVATDADLHLRGPEKLQQLTERFTAMYDLTYGPGSGATSSLTVSSDNSGSSQSAASTILAGVINSNGQSISSALQAFTDAPTAMFSGCVMSGQPAEVFARRLSSRR